MSPAEIVQPHLTRLLLIALQLLRQGAEVVLGFKDASPLLHRHGFYRHPVANATVADFAGNVSASYAPALVEQCVEESYGLWSRCNRTKLGAVWG
jgi:hypothetical protein